MVVMVGSAAVARAHGFARLKFPKYSGSVGTLFVLIVAVFWKGGLPASLLYELMPSRCVKMPYAARKTVPPPNAFGLYARPTRGSRLCQSKCFRVGGRLPGFCPVTSVAMP